MTCKVCQAISAIAQIATGDVQKVSDSIKQQRLDVCQHCPEVIHFHFTLPNEKPPIHPLDRCKACGCFIQTKASFEFQCPLNKWNQSHES